MSVDRTVGDTFYLMFTTRQFSNGAPTTLSGTPVVSAYEDSSLTQITAGITLGVDHDSVTGLNLLTIVATGANGYESGKDYNLVITTGTVGGTSVVGEVVGHFSLSLSAAAVDLANGTDGLGAIKSDTAAILTDTAEIGTAGAGLTAIPWNASWDVEVQSECADALTAYNAVATTDLPTNFGDMSITVTTGLVDITQAAADKAWSTATRVLTANTNLNDPTAASIADAVWDEATTGHVTVGTFGEQLKTDVDAILADTNELQGDWANGGRLDLLIDGIKAKTDSLTFTTANIVDANVQQINDVTITGDGQVGTEFGV